MAQVPDAAGVYDAIGVSSNDLPGRLPGRSDWDRAALSELVRRWGALPEGLKLAVLRVAGIDELDV